MSGRLLEENKARVELLFDDSQPVFEVAHSISVRYFEGKRNSQRTVETVVRGFAGTPALSVFGGLGVNSPRSRHQW